MELLLRMARQLLHENGFHAIAFSTFRRRSCTNDIAMAAAHQLVNAIITACAGGHDQASLQVATEEIRRQLLALGSETPDNVACAAQIEFG